MNNRGDRVKLIRCDDPYTKMEPGAEGTVKFIDSLGTVFVDWDEGGSLGLIPHIDQWVTIK